MLVSIAAVFLPDFGHSMSHNLTLALLRQFVGREFKQRYLSSLSGPLWALMQPLLMLAVYSLVFVHVLRVRLPHGDGPADTIPFLVAALWPWAAFAESLSRAVGVVPENAALLAKVAMPRAVLVAAPMINTFAVQGVGLIAAGLVLGLVGYGFDPAGVPLAALGYLLLFGFTLGLGFGLAALNVFVRDIGQMVPQVLTLLFFLSPVFFTREMVPPAFALVFDINPLSLYLDLMRGALLGTLEQPMLALGLAAMATVGSLAVGYALFRRLASHFEDFV